MPAAKRRARGAKTLIKTGKKQVSVKDILVATAVANGTPLSVANTNAGLAPTTALSPVRRNLVDTIREDMQQKPEHRFEDDAQRLIEFAKNPLTAMSQVRATEAHIKMMGYDAPARVEINERRDIHSAVLVLHALADKAGVTPNKLLFSKIQEAQIEQSS